MGMKGKLQPDENSEKEPRVSGVLLELGDTKRPAGQVSDLAAVRRAGHLDPASDLAVASAGRASGSVSDRPAAGHLGRAADFVDPACHYAAGSDYSFSLLQGRYCPSASEGTIALSWDAPLKTMRILSRDKMAGLCKIAHDARLALRAIN
jgi:hypothetical protein